jgi:hypothetical protein
MCHVGDAEFYRVVQALMARASVINLLVRHSPRTHAQATERAGARRARAYAHTNATERVCVRKLVRTLA